MTDGTKDYDLSEEEKALEAEAQADTGEPEPEEEPAKEAATETPEAPEEGAEEPAEEPAAEEPEKEPKQVSLQALDAERHKRKSVEAELSELKQQFGQFVQAIQSGQQQPQEQPQGDDMPDPVVEPDKFKAWLREQQTAAQQPYQQMQEQYRQAQQMQQQVGQLRSWAAQHEEHFKKEHPDKDYDGALNFMRDKVRSNLEMLGYSPQEQKQMVAQEEAKVVALAHQRGVNPAAYVYQIAAQSGWQEKPAQQEQPSEAESLERLAQTQRQTKSAGTAGGQPREDELTLESVARMSEAEIAKLSEAEMRRLMGE